MTSPHFKKNAFYVYDWVASGWVPARACGGQKRSQDNRELEIQVIVTVTWIDTGN